MPHARRLAATALVLAVASVGRSAVVPARPTATNWLNVVVATPEGGIRQGNPNAPVKLLEFGSLTCPHCGAFARESVPALRARYVSGGRVSYEYRPFILNGVDFAPSLLVRCSPPAVASRLIDAFYAQQAVWTAPFTRPLPDDAQKRIAALPADRQIVAFAAQGGLDAFVRPRGVTRARFDACTSDKAGIAKLAAIREDATRNYGLTSVPHFAINGRTVPETSTWDRLQPALDAAL